MGMSSTWRFKLTGKMKYSFLDKGKPNNYISSFRMRLNFEYLVISLQDTIEIVPLEFFIL